MDLFDERKGCPTPDELRHNFKMYMLSQRKKDGNPYEQSTANTMSFNVFSIYRNMEEKAFWEMATLDEASLREALSKELERSYPNQMKYLSGYMTSFRNLQKYLRTQSFSIAEPTIKREEKGKARAKTTGKGHSILTLSTDEIEAEHQKVLADAGYGSDYQIIHDVLNRFPKNTEPEIVAAKISLIDMTNSTHLGLHRKDVTLSELVKLICGIKDFDVRIRQGDPDLVNILAKSNGKRNLFSFATKYCTYHNVDIYRNDDYSIYDSVVAKNLFRYVLGLSAAKVESWRTSFNYAAFSDCIGKLLDENEVFIEFRRRKFDHFLWYRYRK